MVKNKKKHSQSNCQKNIYFLKYLQTLPIKRRNKLIKDCSKHELNAIIEIIFNFLYDNINISKYIIRSLKKYNRYFNLLIKKSTSNKIKKSILISPKGGFILSTLLRIGLPILTKLFFSKND